MDVKYGINDAFTFDMTLIPDFGQANFDNSVLNLTPFEQEFTEQRSFFTEGTELFNKGNMFYSRRVGDEPSLSPNVSQDETLVESPAKVKFLMRLKFLEEQTKVWELDFSTELQKKPKLLSEIILLAKPEKKC
jgi:hypothetical protein